MRASYITTAALFLVSLAAADQAGDSQMFGDRTEHELCEKSHEGYETCGGGPPGMLVSESKRIPLNLWRKCTLFFKNLSCLGANQI